MRRSTFLELGGFDTHYEKPSIEDVELGLRLWRSGGRLILDPRIQGCHHKRWTLCSMVSIDVLQRAVPWSRLILEQGENPATEHSDVEPVIPGLHCVYWLSLFAPFRKGGWLVGSIVSIGL
jgi:hypothetical protein